jgi:lipopolysaccharide biosynthesis protein
MKRLVFYVFYDQHGIVDDYIIYQIKQLREHVEHIVFVVNGLLTAECREKISPIVDTLFCRKNEGFDVGGHKEALAYFGSENLIQYDEVIMMNMTCYGPIFPLKEIFEWSETQNVSFWGLSDHDKLHWYTDKHDCHIPRHIQSNFIVARKKMVDTPEFRAYWNNMPTTRSYEETIFNHEATFTTYFAEKGHRFAVYINLDNYTTSYPTFYEILDTLKARSPFVKRRVFFECPLFVEKNAVQVNKIIPQIQSESDYPVELIYQNLARTVKPRDLAVNTEALKIFDDSNVDKVVSDRKIAVLLNTDSLESLEEALKYSENIAQPYDLYITISNHLTKNTIDDFFYIWMKQESRSLCKYELNSIPAINQMTVQWFLMDLKETILNKGHNLFCKIDMISVNQSEKMKFLYLKDYLLGNVLGGKNYVEKLLKYLESNQIGMLIPSQPHLFGLNPFCSSWGGDKEKALLWAEKLGIEVPFDDALSSFSYGSTFWFKKESLKMLFEYPFCADNFSEDANSLNTISNQILNHLFVYVAHQSGYLTSNVMFANIAESAYTKLEYKTSRLMSHFSNGNIEEQMNNLALLRKSNCSPEAMPIIGVKFAVKNLIRACGRFVNRRYPNIAKLLKPIYYFLLNIR